MQYKNNTLQYRSIQSKTKRYNTKRFNSTQYETSKDTGQWAGAPNLVSAPPPKVRYLPNAESTQYATKKQYTTLRYITVQYNTVQHDAMQHQHTFPPVESRVVRADKRPPKANSNIRFPRVVTTACPAMHSPQPDERPRHREPSKPKQQQELTRLPLAISTTYKWPS